MANHCQPPQTTANGRTAPLQTADDIEALARTWTAEQRRSYGRYAKFGKAIRLLAAAGWNSRAITDRFIETNLIAADQRGNLYHHITRFRRSEGI